MKQREIKFRRFYTDNKKMIYEYEKMQDLELYGFDEYCMQYTGLKDKNGKDIYEGDVVTGDLSGNLDVVVFESGCFCLDKAMINYEATYWGREIQVIGNIYENPELLK